MIKYLLIIYLATMNIAGFSIMAVDKKKAIKNKWRIRESTLLCVSLIGGSIGMLLGMHTFHHKTKHLKFTIGVPFILILQIVISLFILYYIK